MNCFPCFRSQRSKKTNDRSIESPVFENPIAKPGDEAGHGSNLNIQAQSYTFRELATATKNFRQECLVGEGGFGRVYKGTFQSTGQVVAVKQLDRNGMQGNKEFLGEVMTLSLLHHQNLINLIGYCADGEQRLLVYEFMSGGTVEDLLFDLGAEQKGLDWYTRMQIAFGVAQGLEYLHDKAVIYRDLKSSNILLDENMIPKLSDFGLAKLGSAGEKMHVSSRVMGTYGYCAPEYGRSGSLTLKSDVYSFGVVVLELITGRRAIDTTKPIDEQNLVSWAQPLFRDPKGFPAMADPHLKNHFPEQSLNQAVAIAAMCLQEEPGARPLISDVVTALSFLSIPTAEPIPSPPIIVPPQSSFHKVESERDVESDHSLSKNRLKEPQSSTSSDTDNEEQLQRRISSKSSHCMSKKRSESSTSSKSSRKSSKRSSGRKSVSSSDEKLEEEEWFQEKSHFSSRHESSSKGNGSSRSHKSNSSKSSSRKSEIHIDQRSSKRSSDSDTDTADTDDESRSFCLLSNENEHEHEHRDNESSSGSLDGIVFEA